MVTSLRSRRSFIHFLGLNGLAAAAGSCGPSSLASTEGVGAQVISHAAVQSGGILRLDSNENSSGPGPHVLAAIQDAFGGINRYPFAASHKLSGVVAQTLGVETDQVELGCGSSEILEAAVSGYTSPERALVTAAPTFEMPGNIAHHLGHPVVEVPLTDGLVLDLGQMADRAKGAGLFYVCNPNNPTGTLHGANAMEQF